MKLLKIYEARHTDGYKDFGSGVYFENEKDAVDYAKKRWKGYGTRPKEWNALTIDDEHFFILKKEHPVKLAPELTLGYNEELVKRMALAKLNDLEKQVLGLPTNGKT